MSDNSDEYAIFLGGAGEIGANSIYIRLGDIGIIIDSGMHPKKNQFPFPKYELLDNLPVDFVFLTHSHVDHIGALPYLLKYFPHIKIFASEATADLCEIMLKDTSKILKNEASQSVDSELLKLYEQDILEKIAFVIKKIKFGLKTELQTASGSEFSITFTPAGHILGAASLLIDYMGKQIFISGDISFHNQSIIKGAVLPITRVNTLITESTNCATISNYCYKSEKKRLADFINKISQENGSVLLPCFALGKTQEMISILYTMMRHGEIPHLPIYSGGLSRKISRIYDVYCYSETMIKPGFEISDVPTFGLDYNELNNGGYFKESAIVVAQSGMVHKGSAAFKLAAEWIKRRNFGIGIVGWQDELSPGKQLQNSKKDENFIFADETSIRKCQIENFRFSSHAGIDDINVMIRELQPSNIFIWHGDEDARDNLASTASSNDEKLRIIRPDVGIKYNIFRKINN